MRAHIAYITEVRVQAQLPTPVCHAAAQPPGSVGTAVDLAVFPLLQQAPQHQQAEQQFVPRFDLQQLLSLPEFVPQLAPRQQQAPQSV